MLTKKDLKLIDCFTFKYNCPKNANIKEASVFFSTINTCVGFCEDTHIQYSGRLFDVRLKSILDNRNLPKSWLNEYAHSFAHSVKEELTRKNISVEDFILGSYDKETIFDFNINFNIS